MRTGRVLLHPPTRRREGGGIIHQTMQKWAEKKTVSLEKKEEFLLTKEKFIYSGEREKYNWARNRFSMTTDGVCSSLTRIPIANSDVSIFWTFSQMVSLIFCIIARFIEKIIINSFYKRFFTKLIRFLGLVITCCMYFLTKYFLCVADFPIHYFTLEIINSSWSEETSIDMPKKKEQSVFLKKKAYVCNRILKSLYHNHFSSSPP